MDDIKQRLSETTAESLNAYEAWSGNMKDSAARETLQECIHEMRKVTSRLEIEIAMSERDQMTSKPIPIPAHKSNKRGGGNGNQAAPQAQQQNTNDASAEIKKTIRRGRKPKAATQD